VRYDVAAKNLQNALTPPIVLANFHDRKIFPLSDAEAPAAGTIHGIRRQEDFPYQGSRKTSRAVVELRVGAAECGRRGLQHRSRVLDFPAVLQIDLTQRGIEAFEARAGGILRD